jgi:hypothetical protein
MSCRIAAAFVGIACAATPPPPKDAYVASAPSPPAGALPAEQPRVSGQVRLPGGAPAEGALVALVSHFEAEYPGASPDVPMVIADAQGRYAFAVVTATGRVGVTATLGAKAVGGYGGVHDVGASTPLEIDLVLGNDGFTIRGTVRDAQGASVAGARIEANGFSDNEGEVFVTTSDSAGRYEMSLPKSAAYFVVADVRGLPRVYRRIEPVAQSVDFSLDRAPAPRPSDAAIATYCSATTHTSAHGAGS